MKKLRNWFKRIFKRIPVHETFPILHTKKDGEYMFFIVRDISNDYSLDIYERNRNEFILYKSIDINKDIK